MIEDIIKVLKYRKHYKLAKLLVNSYAQIEESSTYGSYYYSLLSTLEIYSPIEDYELLKNISSDEYEILLEIVLEVIPPKARSPEINHIEFFLDPNLESSNHQLPVEDLEELSFEYIKQQIAKCNQKLSNGDYEGVITNSRSLIESVLLMVLEKTNTSYKYKGNLIKLYNKVSKLLAMQPSEYPNNSIRQILSGFISVINGLSNLRNTMSDAHGKIERHYYKPARRHAELSINAAKTISDFIYKSYETKYGT